MTVQTSYTKNQRVALAGLLKYGFEPTEVVSRAAEGDIPFGIGVGLGTDAEKQAVPGVGAGFLGIAVRTTGKENSLAGETVTYFDEETIAAMRQGYIWAAVVAAITVAVGDPVYMSDTTGEFKNVTDTGFTLVENATFETAGTDLQAIRIGV